jgi:hypothetical protein
MRAHGACVRVTDFEDRGFRDADDGRRHEPIGRGAVSDLARVVVAPAARRARRRGAGVSEAGRQARRRRRHDCSSVADAAVVRGVGPSADLHAPLVEASSSVAAIPVLAAGLATAAVDGADEARIGAVAVQRALHHRLVAAAVDAFLRDAVRAGWTVAVARAFVRAAAEVTDEGLGAVTRERAVRLVRELTRTEAELVAHALETCGAVALRTAFDAAATEAADERRRALGVQLALLARYERRPLRTRAEQQGRAEPRLCAAEVRGA